MGAFINNTITLAGNYALARAIAGGKLNFTKIVLGDGEIPDTTPIKEIEGVISPKATIDIAKLKVNDDRTAIVGGTYTNNETSTGFYWRELGLYAEDPDSSVGEILYCYGNAGSLAEWIPPSGSQTTIEKSIDILTYIGDAANVSIYIAADAYTTIEQYETYKAIALGAQAAANTASGEATAALMRATSAESTVASLANTVADNKSKVTTLWDAVFSEVTSNPFTLTFADLDGITLKSGVWNTANQRIEC